MIERMEKKVNFDICTHCNHACTFCSNSDPRTIKSQVNRTEFSDVMENLTRYVTVTELGLSAKGEVLINKDLEQIIRIAKERFHIPYLYFSTNGALLNPRRAYKILEAGIDSIKFSINATDPKHYETVHRSDDFPQVIDNLKELIDLKKSRFPHLKILISVVGTYEKEEVEKTFSTLLKARFNLIDRVLFYPITYTSKFEVPLSDKPIQSRCRIPFDEIYINSDCTLGLCCKDYFDEINFGSLIKEDFLKLYLGEPFASIRQMHKRGDFPKEHLCRKCLLYGEM